MIIEKHVTFGSFLLVLYEIGVGGGCGIGFSTGKMKKKLLTFTFKSFL
jgi:hypothetical protein